MAAYTEVAAPCGDRLPRRLVAGRRPPIHERLQRLLGEVAAQLGLDAAGVHGEGPHALVAVALVEADGEQHVGRLGPAVGHPRVVGRALEAGSSRSTSLNRWPAELSSTTRRRRRRRRAGEQPGDEQEVAEVVRAELQLEPVVGGALRAGHDPGVGDEHVERPGGPRGSRRRRADAVQVGQVEPRRSSCAPGTWRGSPPSPRRPCRGRGPPSSPTRRGRRAPGWSPRRARRRRRSRGPACR